MKKFLTFALVCCLVFSSSSTVFATATQWDTSDQANLRYIYQSVTSGGSLYTLVNNIYTRVNTISNTLTDIKGYLYQGNHSIAYWVEAINSWMSPIYGRLTDIITNTLNIEAVAGLLGSTDVVDGTTMRTPYLSHLGHGVAWYLSKDAMRPSWVSYPSRTLYQYNGGLGTITSNTFDFSQQGLLGTLSLQQFVANENSAKFYADLMGAWNSPYTRTRWTDLGNESITPTSGIRGLVAMLEWIQQPVARLSYVLASDERIQAQEAAAANEEAVVDNFIDSSGSGAVSTSDFGSVSDLSSGFKNNISTDASVSGIWNIFNSNNFGWFSQETADQLDTTGSGQRTLKSSGSYPTPLLDQQTEDIMNILGGGDND